MVVAFVDDDDLWHPSKLERQIPGRRFRSDLGARGRSTESHMAPRPLSISFAMPNVVVADGRTVKVFRTAAAAERAIEPRDAVGGIVRVWDETGRRLRLEVGDAVCLDAARVSLGLDGSSSADPRELQTLLHNHLDGSGVVTRAEASLAELLELAVEHDGYAG